MSSTTRMLLDAYAEQDEAWKADFHEAQACLDLEEKLSWGISLLRGLADLEANLQRAVLDRPNSSTDTLLEYIPAFYEMWLNASERHRKTCEDFLSLGYKVSSLDDFQLTVEEGRGIVGNLALEEQIRPIEDLLALVQSNHSASHGDS